VDLSADPGEGNALPLNDSIGGYSDVDMDAKDVHPEISKFKNEGRIAARRRRMDIEMNGQVRRPFMCYPSYFVLSYWNVFMTFTLLLTCILTPLQVAFSSEEEDRAALDIVNNTIDLLFFIDILVIFFSAYYDDEQFRMVEDYSEIAINYLTGWFLIDTVSILPFDLILNSGANPVDGTTQVNGLVRFMKIGRLYKLLKLTKLMRILNVVADRRSILKYLQQMLQISQGVERLIIFLFTFFMVCHIFACLWVMIAKWALADDPDLVTWISQPGMSELHDFPLYSAAFYFTITTITTVGYGDLRGFNPTERLFCSFLMLVGVFSFSMLSSSIAQIVHNQDSTNEIYTTRL
jgi:hypothetical protein